MSDGEAALELDRVGEALVAAQLLVTGFDQVAAALQVAIGPDRELRVRYSALHTRLDLALASVDRIASALRGRPDEHPLR